MVASCKRILVGAVAGTLLFSAPAWADVSDSDVVSAVNKAKILEAGYAVNAHINSDRVDLSSYQNPNDSDDDYKIDAVLMAKAAFDTVGDSVARVIVRFYSRDLSEYKEVPVTAGDVKGFGSGAVTKEQLLSSLALQTNKAENAADRVTLKLQREYFAKPEVVVSAPAGSDSLEINTTMSPSVSDEQCRLNALAMAVDAARVAPDNVQKIKVNFADPAWVSDTKQFVFNTADVAQLWQSVQAPLSSVQPSRVPPSLDAVHCVNGPFLEKRQKLLERIRALSSRMGVGPFMTQFLAIENSVHRGNEASIAMNCNKLEGAVDTQEKSIANLKDFHPTAPKPVQGVQRAMSGASGRWALGTTPIVEGDVLISPQTAINKFQAQFGANSPQMIVVLNQVASILRRNGRAAEADTYAKQALALQNHKH